MFRVGDRVVYGTTGVCRIADIRAESFGGATAQEYYILKPWADARSTIYVSTADTDLLSKMRHLMTKREISSLMKSMADEGAAWISDDRARNDDYSAKIRTGDRREFVKLIRTLYLENEKRKETGRKLSQADTKIMDLAERLLHEEFAAVLGIKVEDVVSFIQERVPARQPAAVGDTPSARRDVPAKRERRG